MPHHLHSSPTGFCGSSRPHIQSGYRSFQQSRAQQTATSKVPAKCMPDRIVVEDAVLSVHTVLGDILLCDPPLRCQVAPDLLYRGSCNRPGSEGRSQVRRRRSGRYFVKNVRTIITIPIAYFPTFPRFIFDSCPDLPVTVM